WRGRICRLRPWHWSIVVGRSPLVTGWQAYESAERLTTIDQGLRRKGQGRENPGGCFLSNGFSRSPGGTGVSTCTLRVGFLCKLCGILVDLCDQRLSTAKEEQRTQRQRHPSPPQPGYTRRLGRSETQLHYRCARRTDE